MTTAVVAPTRERLLAAAREVVEEGGYGAASVLAIAERAGVAGGTLYRHFSSKEELFVELFREVCGGEERAMIAAWEASGDGPAVARLQEVLATFARRALRNPRLAWALLAEPVDPRVDVERLAYRARYTALVTHAVQAAVDAGEVPPQDVPFTAAAIIGGCGEALVGPLSPAGHPAGARASTRSPTSVIADPRRASTRSPTSVIASLTAFVGRAVGAGGG